MKIRHLFLAIIAIVAIQFISCDNESKKLFIPSLKLNDSDTLLTYSSDSKVKYIELNTNLESIKVVSSENWCSISVEKTNFIIELSKNKDVKVREAIITITGNNITTKLKIVQLGIVPTLIINSKKIDINHRSQNFSIDVVANVNLNVTVEDSWVTQVQYKQKKSTMPTIKFTFEVDITDKPRSTVIYFYNKEKLVRDSVIVNQAAESIITYVSDSKYNLNVVYFVPKGSKLLQNYHKRVSGIVLYMQKWYKKEMKSYGYPEKTFGLFKQAGKSEPLIKITVINGKEISSFYPYEGGGSKVIKEIKTFSKKNPNIFTSDHTLVFMPSVTGEHGWNAGGVPFYGMGKICFVLDYKYFDMTKYLDGTREGNSSWIGGTAHELGHGLNLPHNSQKKENKWTALMGTGNGTFTKNPELVHLTRASAAILNNCQVFSKKSNIKFYQQKINFKIESLKIKSVNEKISISGSFNSNVDVNAVIVYNDPKVSPTDMNYNAITLCTSDIKNNSFNIDIPIASIHDEYHQYPFELRLYFCHKNGNVSVESFQYTISKGNANINIDLREYKEIDKSKWKVFDFSSEENKGEGANNGFAKYIIDGDESTFWHSQWANAKPDYPHQITINLNRLEEIKGLTFVPRKNKIGGRPHKIKVEVSKDSKVWTKMGDYELTNISLKQHISFESITTVKYFRVNILTGYGDGNENVFFTAISEVGAFTSLHK